MANRHLSRSVAMQTLFEWDSNGQKDSKIKDVLERNIKEFAPGMGDFSFAKSLIEGVLSNKEDLDRIIEKAAPDWPLDKISSIDRNILRIGLYELLFADRSEVPTKVAINEAIELAKSFGGESSGRFVNGVLGAVYKGMGEPGKNETSRVKNKPKQNVPYDKMPQFKLGGAVIYARHVGDIYLALVHDIFGHWTLSKGGIEDNEDVALGTMRKIKEEIGLDIKIKEELGKNEYIASDPKRGKIRKEVTYFLAESDYVDLKLQEDQGGLDDVKWFKLADIINLNFYDDILPIVTKAINILLKK